MDIKKIIGSQLVEYGQVYFDEIMTPEISYKRLVGEFVEDSQSLGNFVKTFIRDIGNKINKSVNVEQDGANLIINGCVVPLKEFTKNFQTFVIAVSKVFN